MWVYKRSFEIHDSKISTALSSQTSCLFPKTFLLPGPVTPAANSCLHWDSSGRQLGQPLELPTLQSPDTTFSIIFRLTVMPHKHCSQFLTTQDSCSLTSAGFAELLCQGTCAFAGLEALFDQWSWVFQGSSERVSISQCHRSCENSKSPFPLTAVHSKLPDVMLRLQAAGDWHGKKMQGAQIVMDTTRKASPAQSPRSCLRAARDTLANRAFCFSCTLACHTVFVILNAT